MSSSHWIHVLTELAPLDGLDGPLSRSARLCYTCISVSKKYLALGSNTGGVYIFSRDSFKHLQVVYPDVEASSVAVVALSPNDLAVAFAISSGQVVVMELNIDRRCRPERLRLSTDHVGFTVTALYWDTASGRLFIGDSVGKISVAYVPSSKAKTLFTQPSEVIVRLDSSVIQLSWWDKKLLVSTVTRSYLLNTSRHQYSQIGKKLRDGEYGSCFFVEPSCQYPVVYCARPGSRVWEVDFEGNVLNTHLFKKLLAIPPLPVIKFRSDGIPPFDELQKYDAQSVAFNKMCLTGTFLITWNNKRIYIFDPARVKMILWSEQDTAVQDIATQGNEIYIYYTNHTVSRFHLLPLQQCLHLLCVRRKWTTAGCLLSYCNSFVGSSVIQQHVKTDTLAEIIEHVTSQGDITIADKLQTILDEFVSEHGASDIDSNSGDTESDSNSRIVRLPSGIFVVNEGLPVGFEHQAKTSKKGEMVFEDVLLSSEKGHTASESHLISSEEDHTAFEGHMISSEKGYTVLEDSLTHSEKEDILKDNLLHSETELVQFLIGDVETDDGSIGDDKAGSEQNSELMSADVECICPSAVPSEHSGIVNGSGLTAEAKQLLSNTSARQTNIQAMENLILIDNLHPVTETNMKTGNDLLKVDKNNSVEDCFDGRASVDTERNSLKELVCEISSKLCTENRLVNGMQSDTYQEVDSVNVECRPNCSSQASRTVGATSCDKETTSDVIVEKDTTLMSSSECSTTTTVQSQVPIADISKMADQQSEIKQAACDKISSSLFSSATSDIVYRSRGHCKKSASSGSLRRKKNKEKKLIPTTSVEEETDISLYTKVDLDPDTVSIDTLSSVEEGEATPDNVSLGEIDGVPSCSTLSKSRPPVYPSTHEVIPSLIQRLSAGGATPGIDDLGSRDGSPSHSQSSSTGTSPRTALLSVKESLSNKTKFLFETIRKKSLLGKSPTSASEPDLREVPGLPSSALESPSLSSKGAPVENCVKDVNQNVDDDSWNHFRVDLDLSSLQTATDCMKTKLQDFTVLTDPNTLKSQLLKWVKELHLTLCLLHQEIDKERWNRILEKRKQIRKKQEEAELLKHEYKFEGDELKTDEADLQMVNCSSQKQDEDCQEENTDFESSSEDQTTLDDTAGQSSEEMGNSCECNNQSQPVSQFSNENDLQHKLIPEIADSDQVDSDGKNLNSEGNTLHVLPPCKTEAETQDEDIAPIDWLEVCHVINPFSIPQQLNTDVSELVNLCLETGCHGNLLKFVSKHTESSEPAATKQGMENSDASDNHGEPGGQYSCECCVNQLGCASGEQDCMFDTEMAQFVKSYFHWLDVDRAQKTLLHWHRNLYHTWSALVTCSEDIGRADRIGAKLENKDIHSATDLLRSAVLTNMQAFLGHFTRLFSINTSHAVEFAAGVPEKVSAEDIVNLCWRCNRPVAQVFSKYLSLRLGETPSHLKLCVMKEICLVPWLQLTALDSLLRQALLDHMTESDMPRPGSHLIKLATEDVIESVLDICVDTVEEDALSCCKKYRYWKGCLRFLKKKQAWQEMLWIIVHLADVTLLDDNLSYGYLPQSNEQWHYFLQEYSDERSVAQRNASAECAEPSDWSVSLTWQCVCERMVGTLGPVTAVRLLQEFDIPPAELSSTFFQMCIKQSLIQQQQRLVLHNMLEKIDTYLWAKRSPHMAPQLLYVVSEEKKSQSGVKESEDDSYQELFGQISNTQNLGQTVEDPESHWGLPVDINSRCCNCNLKLAETVSHVVPGVTVFQCGHTFHKFCIPQKRCLLCDT